MTWIQRRLKYWCWNYKWYREWVGGYWEQWYIDAVHSEIWFDITKKEAYEGFRPGCGYGTPYCEYYGLNFFEYKTKFTKETKIKLDRQQKLKRILG